MKKITVCSMFLICSATSFSQNKNPAPTLTKEDYMQKSKKQKTAARLLLGGGATVLLVGIIIPKGDLVHEGFLGSEYERDRIKAAFELTGMLSMIGSIPFFTAARKNNKRAISLSFKTERIQQLNKSSFAYKRVPSLNLKINL